MDPAIARAGLTIAGLMSVMGILLLLFQERGTAEYFVTLLTVIIGLTFTLGIVLVVKISRR